MVRVRVVGGATPATPTLRWPGAARGDERMPLLSYVSVPRAGGGYARVPLADLEARAEAEADASGGAGDEAALGSGSARSAARRRSVWGAVADALALGQRLALGGSGSAWSAAQRRPRKDPSPVQQRQA